MDSPRPRLPSLSIVLPCHDEAANVVSVARDAVRAGRRVAERLEVLVVDDGSRDDTFARAAALGAELPEVRAIQNPVNLGYGGALRRGFAEARMAWVFFTDGDGQFELDQLDDLVGDPGVIEVAVGYRHPRMDPRRRVLLGRLWTALGNGLLGLGVRDLNCAFKLLPRELLDRAELGAKGAAISAELLLAARQHGYRIAERPVRHRPRTAGRQSGSDPVVALRAVVELVALVHRRVVGAAARARRLDPSSGVLS